MDDKELRVIWLVAIFNETVILACWRVESRYGDSFKVE